MLLFFLYKGIKNMLQTASEELINKFEILQNENIKLRNENIKLREELSWFKKQIFGQKSERRVIDKSIYIYPPGWEKLFDNLQGNNNEEVEKQKISAHTRRRKKRKNEDKLQFSDDVPVETIIIDIPEDKKFCPNTGIALAKIGNEVTYKLVHNPSNSYVQKIIRPKYALPKGAGIIVADPVESFIPKSCADESFLAEVLIRKFVDHMPLYRMSESFLREGIKISSKLLSQWVVRIGIDLKPLYDLMIQEILESENIFIDETKLNLLQKKKCKQCCMITMIGGKEQNPTNRIYAFREKKTNEDILGLVEGYKGVFHSDKLRAYENFAKEEGITWCPCWAHIRRKFLEAEFGDMVFKDSVLRKINYLFAVEKIAWKKSLEERINLRFQKSEPIINALIKQVKKRVTDKYILPKSKLKKAILYFLGLEPYLKNYIKHPWAHLDNNTAERAIRALVIGRKNWLFVGSKKAGEATAVILSLVQTCRGLKINPREYLEDVLRRFMSHPFKKLYELLPSQWGKNKNIKKPP
jgi:transposase